MGVLGGFGPPRVRLRSLVRAANPNPAAAEPLHISADVDSPEYGENKGMGIHHNPKAKIPLHRPNCPGPHIASCANIDSWTAPSGVAPDRVGDTHRLGSGYERRRGQTVIDALDGGRSL